MKYILGEIVTFNFIMKRTKLIVFFRKVSDQVISPHLLVACTLAYKQWRPVV